ncbi:MAG: mandelate racemase/muconate lactonizing enzyme family protein [Armatimonadota bacterium]|nr:mandelate racemase/muconate lactonizing enzyme family protein [Armatimonadota bacterium]MDR7518250.1 mandelate racemase/muconate lactonizing enzyme family protein [Armatimonadota bacterium]MDR7548674.1 mandelate racemase/muconate lactonizing enzyme family protein [Armatimonadota bacterium]
MRIAEIAVFGYDLHYVHGDYVMSGERTVRALPSTVTRVTTDEGLVGWGETCPLGQTYLPAFAAGARAALRELAPALVGADPCNLAEVHRRLDGALAGFGYAKSPLEIACWDIFGRASGYPVYALLGGQRQASYPLYVAVPLGSAEAMVAYVRARQAEGIHRFQLKVGADPRDDAERVRRVVEATGDDDLIIADANGGWRLQDAVVAARLLEPLPRVFLEQPCPTLEECAAVRKLTALPMIYDEVVTDVPSLLAVIQVGGASAVNLKISRVGGLSRARVLCDLAQALGLSVTIEDTWGGDVTTAAVSHLAATVAPEALFTVSFMNDWTAEHIAGHQPRSHHGVGGPNPGPGLGIEVDAEALGQPLFTCR